MKPQDALEGNAGVEQGMPGAPSQLLDTVEGQVEKDTLRLNWLEHAAWNHPDSGNGIALFPTTNHVTGEKGMDLHGLGDEDGSGLGDELTATYGSLRDVIDAAMQTFPAPSLPTVPDAKKTLEEPRDDYEI